MLSDPVPSPCCSAWRFRTRSLDLAGPVPKLMGIVNVTPDSFSDGGNFFDPDRAIQHGLRLADAGADVLDVGGESTRPYAEPVLADEELRRVTDVVQGLCSATDVPISIDTSKAVVARACLEVGAEIINDVTALTADPDMLPLALESGAGICAMHMQGTPQTMQVDPQYKDVVGEIQQYLATRRDEFLAEGIAAEKICLDPGVGFGKTHEHNLEIMTRVREFHALGTPLLVGHSRKGFLAKIIEDRDADRLSPTIGVALALARARVQVIRVHDVESVRHALLAFAAAGGLD